MRQLIIVLLLGRVACGQALVENAAAAAGGSVGGVAGKKVSDGLSNIFNKVDRHMAKAASSKETSKSKAASQVDEPLMEVGPGTHKAPSVPPPPPVE